MRQGYDGEELLHSADGGQSWDDLTDSLRAVAYAGDRPAAVEVLSAHRVLVRTEVPAGDEPSRKPRRGFVYATRDAGAHWQRLGAGVLDRHEAEQMEWGVVRHGQRVWYARSSAGLFRRAESASAWTRLRRGVVPSITVARKDGEIIVVGPADEAPQEVQVSRDGGDSWRRRSTPVQVFGAPVIAPGNADVIYLQAASGLVASHDGGRRWRHRGDAELRELAVSPHDADDLYARGRDDLWLHSDDGGDHWHEVGAGPLERLVVAWSPVDRRAIYLGYQRLSPDTYPDTEYRFWRSSDGGRAWRPVVTAATLGDLSRELVLHPASTDLVLAAGNDDVLLSRDGGGPGTAAPTSPWARGSCTSWSIQTPAAPPGGDRLGPLHPALGARPTPVLPPRTAASYDTAQAVATWEWVTPLKHPACQRPDPRPRRGPVARLRRRHRGHRARRHAGLGRDPRRGTGAHRGTLARDPGGGMWCGTACFDGAAWHDRTPATPTS